MKKTSTHFSSVLVSFLSLFLSCGFINKKEIPYSHTFSGDSSVSTAVEKQFVSKTLLSYKDQPVCVVEADKHPGLVPSFFKVTSSKPEDIQFNLPECNSKDIRVIQSLSQQAVLLDERGGYQVAVGPAAVAIPAAAKAIHAVLCVGGAVYGSYQAKKLKERGLENTSEASSILQIAGGWLLYAINRAKSLGTIGICSGIGGLLDLYEISFF